MVKRAILNELAASRQITLHDSYFTELENYSGHMGVKDLSTSDLEIVLEELTKKCIELAVKSNCDLVGGGAAREVINQLCDPFSDCRKAASKILNELSVPVCL